MLALNVLTANCGSSTTGSDTGPVESPHPAAHRHLVKRWQVVVTVVDGDTRRRVRSALVRVGGEVDRANRLGNAAFQLRRRAPLVVSVRAHGYSNREVRMPFQRRPRVVIRVYRNGLQWPMYGATRAWTQAHSAIRLRPPFRLVWSRGPAP